MLVRQITQKMTPTSAMWILVFAMALFDHSMVFSADVGVNYGRIGDNLPSPTQVVNFLTKDLNYAIPLVRLFDADGEVLEALRGTNLVVSVGVPNEDIPNIASSYDAADKWVNDHIKAYSGVRFRYVCVGNEAIPGFAASSTVVAMRNIHQSLSSAGLTESIQVTTAVPGNVLGSSYPPSSGQFAPDIANIMNDVSRFVYSIGSPLLINVYPYFALVADPQHISLGYATFDSSTVVKDGNLEYHNLFDAMVDAFVAAMVRAVGKEDVKVAVSESGWPAAGNMPYTTIDHAQFYNNNLRKHVMNSGGTPRRPDLNLETYVFGLFNENLKAGEVEKSFGTFYPNLTEVYPLWR